MCCALPTFSSSHEGKRVSLLRMQQMWTLIPFVRMPSLWPSHPYIPSQWRRRLHDLDFEQQSLFFASVLSPFISLLLLHNSKQLVWVSTALHWNTVILSFELFNDNAISFSVCLQIPLHELTLVSPSFTISLYYMFWLWHFMFSNMKSDCFLRY